MDQPGMVANPTVGQLDRENHFPYSCLRRLKIWSRETGSTVPSRVRVLILSTVRLNLVLTQRSLLMLLREYSAALLLKTTNPALSQEFNVYANRNAPKTMRLLDKIGTT